MPCKLMPVNDISQQPRSWEGMGQLCSLNALPPSDLAHDLFPGATPVGTGSRMAVTLKGHWCLNTKGLRLGGVNRGLLGTFRSVAGLISRH